MPVLHVRALPQADPSRIKPALKKTCMAIADIYQCPVEHVLATWEEIRPGWYVEGKRSGSIQPLISHPPIADLYCLEGKTPVEIEEILLVASKTLGSALELGDNVHMTYHEVKSGRVVNGGTILRK